MQDGRSAFKISAGRDGLRVDGKHFIKKRVVTVMNWLELA